MSAARNSGLWTLDSGLSTLDYFFVTYAMICFFASNCCLATTASSQVLYAPMRTRNQTPLPGMAS